MHAGRNKAQRRVSGKRIVFRVAKAEQIADRHGLTTIEEKAQFFNTTATTYSRVCSRLIDPGRFFIADVLSAEEKDPEITWDNLFELVDRTSTSGIAS
jgi:hypothetical protein